MLEHPSFSDGIRYVAAAIDGYGTLSGYNAADNAAFALATPYLSCGGGSGG